MVNRSVSTLRFLFVGALVVLVGVTCTDGSLTGPRSHRGALARLGFAPAFSKAAAEIFQSLEEFGFAVNNVHVRLAHANGTFAKDTTIAIGSGQDSVVIEMAVNLNSIQEELEANIELRDDKTVLFSGTQSVTAKVGTTSPPPPPIEVDYTGPGAGATTLTLAPSDTAVLAGDSVRFRPSAKNGAGQNVPDLALAWSVRDDARGAVNANGVFKASLAATRGGTYVIARLLSGPKDSAHVSVVPAATNVALISGADQTGTVGKPLGQPIVVEARANDNLPVPFVRLTFGAVTGGGSVAQTSAFSDANGRATLALTLGTTAGANTVQVSGTGITPLQVSATGVADVAAKLGVVQQPSAGASSGTVLSTQPAAQVQDTYGNAVAASNVPINASLTSPNGRTLSGTLTVNTNASGLAQFTDLKMSGPPGAASLTFSSETLASAVSSTVNVTIGPPVALSLEGASSFTAAAGALMTNAPALVVSDAGGNGVANVDLLVAVSNAEGPVGQSTIKTDANGRVLLSGKTAPTLAGPYTFSASNDALSGSPITVLATITNAAANRVRFMQQPPTNVSAGATMPIVVELLDQFNNRVTTGAGSTANVTLGLGGGTGGAVLGPDAAARTQAAVAGVATFNVSVDLVGTGYALSATTDISLPAVASSPFDVVGGAVASIAAILGDNVGLLKGEETRLIARVTDALGNKLQGTPITFTVISGGGLLNSDFQLITQPSGTDGTSGVDYNTGGSGVQLVRASAGSVSVDFRAFIAEALVVIQEPSANVVSGVKIATQPQVELRDLQGNVVRKAGVMIKAGYVQVPVQDLLTRLDGAIDAITDANGDATWSDLILSGQLFNPTTPQTVRLTFAQDVQTPTINSGASQIISIGIGPASKYDPDFNGLYRRVDPGTSGNSLGVRVSDGINGIPGQQIDFALEYGTCTLESNSATTDASGTASVNITAADSLTSCLVLAQPPGNTDFQKQVHPRIYVAPAPGVPIWVGSQSADWNKAANWFAGVQPQAGGDVFIPAISLFDNIATLQGATDLNTLRVESGGILNLNSQTLTLTGDLLGGGSIDESGLVILAGTSFRSATGVVLAPVQVARPGTICDASPAYNVNSFFYTGSLELNCPLAMNTTASYLSTNGDLSIAAGGSLLQSGGLVSVSGNANIAEGVLNLSNGSFYVASNLLVTGRGALTQSNGNILVQKDAQFSGGISTATAGVLDIYGNLSVTSVDATGYFAATGSHVTRMWAQKGPATITWNDVARQSRLGTLEIQETLATPVGVTLSATSAMLFRLANLFITRGYLTVPDNFTVTLLPESASAGQLSISTDTDYLNLQGTLLPAIIPCSVGGSIVPGINRGPRICAVPQ